MFFNQIQFFSVFSLAQICENKLEFSKFKKVNEYLTSSHRDETFEKRNKLYLFTWPLPHNKCYNIIMTINFKENSDNLQHTFFSFYVICVILYICTSKTHVLNTSFIRSYDNLSTINI